MANQVILDEEAGEQDDRQIHEHEQDEEGYEQQGLTEQEFEEYLEEVVPDADCDTDEENDQHDEQYFGAMHMVPEDEPEGEAHMHMGLNINTL